MNRYGMVFFTILLCCIPFAMRGAPATDVAIVVSSTVPVEDLTFSELRKIVLGDRQFWSSDLRVTVLIRAPGARERDVILKNVLQMSEAQFRQYWIGKVFRAESTSGPKTFNSTEMAVSLINNIPGSVAFVEADQVPKGVKVIRLGGLLPGDKGYPLN
jgi:ABC-type phosphate transport system substrate-binding protein